MTVHFNPKFDDLPLLVLPSYHYPEFDGDMAELHHLADEVIEGVAGGARVTLRPPFAIYNQTVDATWIHAMQMCQWNWDKAGDILREWING